MCGTSLSWWQPGRGNWRLLHDTVEDSEDGAATEARIRREFGDRVGDIVMGCSDAVAVPGKSKPDWLERKQSYLSHLRLETNPDVLLVSACDKLHNARAIASDLRTVGDQVWSRFKVGRDGQLWYSESLVEIHRENTPKGSDADKQRGIVVDDLARAVADIRRLSD
jgi:(p)ppGpp synthase/HD superfamily hydrolase